MEPFAVQNNCNTKIEQSVTQETKDNTINVLNTKGKQRTGLGRTLKGLICAFLWPFLVASSKICVQALEEKIGHLTLNGFWYLISAIGYGLYHMITRQNPKVKRKDMKALVIYSIFLNLSSLAYYVPATSLPLATLESINACFLLLTAALCFGFLIKSLRKVTKKVEIAASASSALGLCLVIQPWQDNFDPKLRVILLGYVVCAVGGILWALEAVLICWYPFLHSQENQIKTLFWNCILGSVAMLPIAFSVEDLDLHSLKWSDWLYAAGHCATFGILQVTYMYACSVIAGTLNLVRGTTNVIYVVIAQYTFLSGIH